VAYSQGLALAGHDNNTNIKINKIIITKNLIGKGQYKTADF
jgi:hypothetical protein